MAEAVLETLLPRADRDPILGDLAEEYRGRRRREGKGAADRWYLGEVLRSLVPALGRRLRRSGGRWRQERRWDEVTRTRGGEGMGAVTRDLAYAVRTLRRRPGFAAVVVATLAVGIGATTAVFSVVDGVLLRPLPYPTAERIDQLWEETEEGGRSWVSAPNFRDWREGLEMYEEVAALTPSGFNVAGGRGPERTSGMEVSPDFFRVLGTEFALGRGFLPEEGGSPPERVVVISHGLWQRQFGGSRDAVGRSLELEGIVYEVVGVLPPDGAYPAGRDVWVPVDLASAGWKRNRGSRWLMVVGLRAPSVEPAAARAEAEALGAALAEEHPDSNEGMGIAAVPLRDELVGDVETPLLVLLGAVGLVLLVVCVNVSGLFLARAARRRREVAIRRSLGGSRGRIARQLVTESLVVSLVGGGLGVLVSFGVLRGLLTLAPPGTPRLDQAAVDGRVLLFGLAISLVAGLVAGVFPALREARTEPREGLRADGGASDGERIGPRSGLVVAQVALAVVLVVGAGHLLSTFRNLRAVDPGFEPRGALAVGLPLTETRYESDDQVRSFYGEVLRGVRALPDVAAAGAVAVLPMGGSSMNFSFELRDAGAIDPRDPVAGYQSASAGYFDAIGIPLLRGRTFREGEGADDEPVVIVDETFAERFLAGRDPLGQEILVIGEEWRRVVGVVGRVRRGGLRGEPRPQFYVPMEQDPRDAMSLVVRAERGEPASLIPAIRRVVADVDPDQPLVAPSPLSELLGRDLALSRFLLTTVAFFGGVTLLLAALGIYGVVSEVVAGRTREIGIRMALGARSMAVRGMVVRRGLFMAALGVGLGLLGAVPSIGLLRGVLYQVPGFEAGIGVGMK